MKPILFSTPMVQAILEGRKSQTRRIINSDANNIQWNPIILKGYGGYCDEHGNPVRPKVNIGNILWVRETWQRIDHPELKYRYKADHLNPSSVTWKPSIFMPKDACRIFLEVTDIRVERLQDISEEDAIAEGIERMLPEGLMSFRSYAVKDGGSGVFPYVSYKTLWQSINGKESWLPNPLVWKITFKND